MMLTSVSDDVLLSMESPIELFTLARCSVFLLKLTLKFRTHGVLAANPFERKVHFDPPLASG